MKRNGIAKALALGLLMAAPVFAQAPVGTVFTYQGRLMNAGSPASGLHDMRFRLYDASVGGAQVGAIVCTDNVSVTEGLFTVPLDFGAQFAGEERFLEIDVRADTGLGCGDPTGFVILAPRQALTAAPYALYAESVAVPLTLSSANFLWIILAENAAAADGVVGVYGAASGASGVTYGGYFQSDSASGHGVLGYASARTGTTYGGRFHNASINGRAVFGRAFAGTGTTYGGRFESDSEGGRGVYGLASATTGTNYGVRGQTSSASGYGVYSVGDFGGTGGKYFRIDHPSDPANKYLNHQCAEGPEPLLIYRGNVTLDARGEARVNLPDYFESINRDFHYQLTCIGAFAPVYVAQEIVNNTFQIAGGTPGLKVSWTVTGVRNDPYMQRYMRPVVEEKSPGERGTYQHPELYGQPPEMGMNYDAERERPSPPSRRAGTDATPQE